MFKNRPDIASDADKVSLLREAMLEPTLKAQVEQYGRGPDGFNSAMEALRIRYGRATVVSCVRQRDDSARLLRVYTRRYAANTGQD